MTMEPADKTMLIQELARTFGHLVRAGTRNRSFMGLRHSEFMLLTTAANLAGNAAEGVKISDLSKALQMTPAGATHLVNSLTESGYLERLPSPRDRRIVWIRVTEQGEAHIHATENHFFELFGRLTEHLGEQDSKELLRLLTKTILFMKDVK